MRFAGRVKLPTLVGFYRSAHAFVFPSKFETQGLVARNTAVRPNIAEQRVVLSVFAPVTAQPPLSTDEPARMAWMA